MEEPAQSAAHRGEGEEARKSRGRREERGQETETGSSGKGRELSLLSLPSAGSLRKADLHEVAGSASGWPPSTGRL